MKEIKRFKQTIIDANNNKKVLKKWIAAEKAKMVYNNDIAYAEEKGRQEGIEEGRQEGIEEGRQEEREELIKNMLNEGSNYNFISKVTGKTVEEILKIKNNIEE